MAKGGAPEAPKTEADDLHTHTSKSYDACGSESGTWARRDATQRDVGWCRDNGVLRDDSERTLSATHEFLLFAGSRKTG